MLATETPKVEAIDESEKIGLAPKQSVRPTDTSIRGSGFNTGLSQDASGPSPTTGIGIGLAPQTPQNKRRIGFLQDDNKDYRESEEEFNLGPNKRTKQQNKKRQKRNKDEKRKDDEEEKKPKPKGKGKGRGKKKKKDNLDDDDKDNDNNKGGGARSISIKLGQRFSTEQEEINREVLKDSNYEAQKSKNLIRIPSSIEARYAFPRLAPYPLANPSSFRNSKTSVLNRKLVN